MDRALQLLGEVVLAGGGITLIVYHAFKHLSVRWLDSKFEERLEAVRHGYEKEIEALRFKISTLLDRASKLHQKEFETLPEAWGKLNESFWSARAAVAALRSYPDINKMPAALQEEFIGQCKLTPWERNELRQADDKNKFYQERIRWHDLHEARGKARDAYTFLLKNGIFFDREIRSLFEAIHDLIWNALVEHELNESMGPPREREKIKELNLSGEKRLKDLEALVHQRLWPKDATAL